jgi:hypothetical protein
VDGTAGQADEDRLYGLMEIAERQQAAVQAATVPLLSQLAGWRSRLGRRTPRCGAWWRARAGGCWPG